MTEQSQEVRVRRPKSKSDLIRKLWKDGEAGPFETMAEALVFAAALGYSRNRREPFNDSEEPIRYSVFQNAHAETLISALAVCAYPEDPAILADGRLQDRVTVFEEYANGGLAELQGEIGGNLTDRIEEIVLDLARSAGTVVGGEDLNPELARLLGSGLGPANWS